MHQLAILRRGQYLYIAMPHCSGGDLASLLARQKKKNKRLPEVGLVGWMVGLLMWARASARACFQASCSITRLVKLLKLL